VPLLIASKFCKPKPDRLATAALVPFLGGDEGVPKKKIEIFSGQQIRKKNLQLPWQS